MLFRTMYVRLDPTHASILDRAAAHCDGNATEALRRLLREWDAADKEGQAFTATRSKNELATPRPKVLSSSTTNQEAVEPRLVLRTRQQAGMSDAEVRSSLKDMLGKTGELGTPAPVSSDVATSNSTRGLRCLDCKVAHGACRVCGSSEAELAERGHVASDGGRVLCQGRVAK